MNITLTCISIKILIWHKKGLRGLIFTLEKAKCVFLRPIKAPD